MTTKTINLPDGLTVYKGTLDVTTGVLTVTMAGIASYNGETIGEPWISSLDEYAAGTTPTTGAQVVYTLAEPATYQLTAEEVMMLSEDNHLWASSGDSTVQYYDSQTVGDAYVTGVYGDPGLNAASYSLIVSHAAISKSTTGTYNPTSITLTAKFQSGDSALADYTGRFKIETTANNTTWTATYTSSSDETTKSYTIPTGIIAVRCSLYQSGGTTNLLDQQTIPIVSDGADGYTVILTNENHTFAAGTTAAIASNTDCSVIAYKGGTQVVATIGTISGQPTGMTTTISNNGTTSAKFNVAVTTSMTTKNGVLTVPVTVDGKTFNMRFTYSLALTGAAGLNNATATLYKRSASSPEGPSGTLTYTFATGKLTGTADGWTQEIPSGTNPVWAIVATASSTGTSDEIPSTEWSEPLQILQDGTSGTDGYNQATIYLYQRAASAPSKPSASITYTFSTGELSSVPTGWSRTIPPSNGSPCYATSASVVSRDGTATIASNTWTDVVKLVEDGEDGVALYGTSSTAAGTAAKVVTCAEATELYTGLMIVIKFTTANTAAAPTLNVNGLGAKNIYFAGANASSSNQFLWAANTEIAFNYNGSAWSVIGHPCTYYGANTVAAATAAKTATINYAVVCKGASVSLQMQYANTAASATLNVSSTGAKAIYAGGAVLADPYNWVAGATVTFTFDGQYWRITEDTSSSLKAKEAQTAADTAQSTANTALAQSAEIIIGTQTAVTGSWTGTSQTITELRDGLQIDYWLPFAGSGNATLNLTLANGTTTGAINVYRQGGSVSSGAVVASRVTTHFPTGSMIRMTYGVNRPISVVSSGTTYTGNFTGWFADGAYDSGNTINRTQYNSAIKAATEITADRIICGTSSGYKNIGANIAFDLSYPLLYSRAKITANSTGTNNDINASGIKFTNNGTVSGAGAAKIVYLKGTVSGTTFTISASPFMTCTTPTEVDGFYYIPLGVMSSSTAGSFSSNSRLYAFIGGAFQPVDTAAQLTANSANDSISALSNDVNSQLNELGNAVDKLGNDLTTINTWFENDEDGWAYYSEQVMTNKNNIEDEATTRVNMIRFTNDGDIEIGKQYGGQASPFKMRLTSSQLVFYENENPVSWFGNQSMYITSAQVTTQFVLGKDEPNYPLYAFIPRDNGSLDFKMIT